MGILETKNNHTQVGTWRLYNVAFMRRCINVRCPLGTFFNVMCPQGIIPEENILQKGIPRKSHNHWAHFSLTTVKYRNTFYANNTTLSTSCCGENYTGKRGSFEDEERLVLILSFFWCLGRVVLHECGIFWVSSIIFVERWVERLIQRRFV